MIAPIISIELRPMSLSRIRPVPRHHAGHQLTIRSCCAAMRDNGMHLAHRQRAGKPPVDDTL